MDERLINQYDTLSVSKIEKQKMEQLFFERETLKTPEQLKAFREKNKFNNYIM